MARLFLRLALLFAALGLAPAHAGQGVHEEAFVPIGGIEQWITIKGDDVANPVVLFLHGGPGDALSPMADAMFAGWEKHLTGHAPSVASLDKIHEMILEQAHP